MSATLPWELRRVTGFLRHGVIGLDQVEPRRSCSIRSRCRRVPHTNGGSLQRSYRTARRWRALGNWPICTCGLRKVTRRNTRVHFIHPLKERIVREVGYGLSLEGASSADLVKSKRSKG